MPSANASLPIRSAEQLLRLRVQTLNEAPPQPSGRCVVYWMHHHRRLASNLALQHACRRASTHGCPLLVVEDLVANKQWAARRHHAFVAAGMDEIRAECAQARVGYLPLVEVGEASVEAVMAELLACAVEVVVDAYPCHVAPALNAALAARAKAHSVRVTSIDANGFLPTRMLAEPCPTAAVFRRYVHKQARAAAGSMAQKNPFAERSLVAWDDTLLSDIRATYPGTTGWLDRYRTNPEQALDECPIDQSVRAVPGRGGRAAGLREMERFLDQRLDGYLDRNHPAADSASGLSPYLHWGQLGAQEIIQAVWDRCGGLDLEKLPTKGGSREGFWPFPQATQGFFDELITWRELAFHTAELLPEYTHYRSIPGWAMETLAIHADDPRPTIYSFDQLRAAETHDEIWNAAQRQLTQDGIIHNYLRMLWAKKVLEWSPSPKIAFDRLVELNNLYALDGRDPNSYAGIAWCFGRYDRPWQQRPIFGTIRYMSSDSTRRKLKLGDYLQRYAGDGQQTLFAGPR